MSWRIVTDVEAVTRRRKSDMDLCNKIYQEPIKMVKQDTKQILATDIHVCDDWRMCWWRALRLIWFATTQSPMLRNFFKIEQSAKQGMLILLRMCCKMFRTSGQNHAYMKPKFENTSIIDRYALAFEKVKCNCKRPVQYKLLS